ncbi:AMIN-like domain-containing (lipo)protein [Streptomyces sp. NPDC003388]|uniref:AMIN-like domain-containing (lipo)protein n=1 Tax=unclassified Streptomyces TaxID=2593676 RepID=UPI00367A6C89
MRRTGIIATVLVLAGAGLGGVATAADAAPAAAARATACPAGWGSGPKGGPATGAVPLKNVRTGRHDCYDRIVFDVPGGGRAVRYHVAYVDRLRQDTTGRTVPVRGGAVLDIRVGAPSYDPATGAVTYPGRVGRTLPGVDVSGYRTFRDTRFAGSFEGETQVGLGVRARLPFRVQQASGRLVVDVAHSWRGAG